MKKVLIFTAKNKNEFSNIPENIDLWPSSYEKMKIIIGKGSVRIFIDRRSIDEFSCVYFKKVLGHEELAASIARYLKSRSIKFYDSYLSNVFYNGKLFQMILFALSNLSVPKTIFLSPDLLSDGFSFLQKNIGLPFVMKASMADRGEDNYLIKSEDDFNKHIKITQNKVYIFQEYLVHDFDFRVLIIDKKVFIYKRIKINKNDHRSNLGLGNIRKKIALDNFPYMGIAKTAAQIYKREIAGVDIIVNKNKPYILEVNTSPGLFSIDAKDEKLKVLYDFLSNK